MFEEIAAKVPDFEVPNHQAGILISSPDAQVYYHADLPGQGLIQIAGRKRVYVYPNTAPFITPQHLEDIALFDVEVDMPYAPWYDGHAQVFDLEPGQMLNWPLNAPHRVENLGTVNISMTVSYGNDEIRRAQIVNLANGLLRHRFGYTPKSQQSARAVLLRQDGDAEARCATANGSSASATRAARSISGSTPTSPARSSICRRRHKPATPMTVLTTSAGQVAARPTQPRGRIPRRDAARLETGGRALERHQPVDAVPASAMV